MWQPSVSVVMCTYNGALYLEQQVLSILEQTYSISEFLIFDDASTDETVKIARRLSLANPVIHVHENPVNLGFNYNFEQALKAATGEVIAIADQDDYWLPQKLEKMIAAWHKEMPVIHCDSQRFSGALPELTTLRPILKRFRGTQSKKLFLFNSVNGHALMVRRNFLPLVLPLENEVYYDWWVAFVASCNGGVDYLNETLVLQRVHDKNASIDSSKSETERFIEYRQMVCRHLEKFVTAPGINQQDQKLGTDLRMNLENIQVGRYRLQLFRLLMHHRKAFFYQKKRAFDFFAHFKYAAQWSFR